MPRQPLKQPLLPSRRAALRRLGIAAVAPAVLLAAGSSGWADVINIKSAELRIEDDGYVVNANFDLNLNSTLEEALQRGVPLYFVREFELMRPRWYWLDEKVASLTQTLRVEFHALTRQYRIAYVTAAARSSASGSLGLVHLANFDTLDEVVRFLSRIRDWAVVDRKALSRGARYEAALRLRLDVNMLPKPFQISALASKEWTLESEWLRWTYIP